MRPRTLVLGVGSPFGADRLGWMAVEVLRERLACASVDFLPGDRPGAGLLALMRGYGQVVLIDALGGAPAGSVRRVHCEELAHADALAVHGFGVAEALALGAVLGDLPPRLTIVGIGMGDGDVPPDVDWDPLVAMVAAEIAH